MSSGDVISVSSEMSTKKRKRRSWFGGRRSIFSRFRQRSSKRKQSESMTSSNEGLAINTEDILKESASITSTFNGHHESSNQWFKKLSQSTNENTTMYTDGVASMECPLCLVTQPTENFPVLSTCQHRSCLNCLRQYLTIEITESRVNLMCPECQEKLHPADMKVILEGEPHLLVKWEEFTLRRMLSIDPDCRWCPAPDCGYAVIAYGCASCPKLICERPGCKTEFCYHCRQEWHPNQTCDSAHLKRTKQLRIRSNSASYAQGSSLHDEIKPCPKCGALIFKLDDGSCNHMTCTVCETEFCWLCSKEINDLHYLSPSGCTFWGRKPWSRKKKILWQLGLLIGAPIGIGLVAVVALPAIAIGVPLWVYRKLTEECESRNMPRYKRNLLVGFALAGSIIMSPALVAMAVGVGVPILLFYVYGIVPFSLCRSGSYGIRHKRSQSPGFSMLPPGLRLDRGGSGSQAGTLSPEDGSNFSRQPARYVPTNPSIGEASVGAMTMGSFNASRGSSLDKAGRIDQDVASTVAMAGMSLTGSISGYSGAGPLGSNRVEIHAKDVDQQSTHTQVSVASNPNCISVQVHMNDNNDSAEQFSNNFPSISGNAVKKSYSSKPLGSKRKSEYTTRSSSFRVGTSSKNQDESCRFPVTTDASTDVIINKPDHLIIVNECKEQTCVHKNEEKLSAVEEAATAVSVSETASISSDDQSDACSSGSQSLLLPFPEIQPCVDESSLSI